MSRELLRKSLERGDRFIRLDGTTSGLTLEDLRELASGTLRVFELMSDGMWHSADEIRLAAGSDGLPASEGLRRLRELRNVFQISKRKHPTQKRLFLYKLERAS